MIDITNMDFQFLIREIDALPYYCIADGEICHLYNVSKLIKTFPDFNEWRYISSILHDLGYKQIVYGNDCMRVLVDRHGKGVYRDINLYEPVPAQPMNSV